MLDTLYTFITTYPGSLPVFFLLVTSAVLGGIMLHDRYKAKQ